MNELRKLIQKTIKEHLNEQQEVEDNIVLYHSLKNKKDLSIPDFIKSVVNNGLIRNDNGEIGNIIWFSKNFIY
jgi:hypothetical protein